MSCKEEKEEEEEKKEEEEEGEEEDWLCQNCATHMNKQDEKFRVASVVLCSIQCCMVKKLQFVTIKK